MGSAQQYGVLEHPSQHTVDIQTTREGAAVGNDGGAQRKVSKRHAGDGGNGAAHLARRGAPDGGARILMATAIFKLDNQK